MKKIFLLIVVAVFSYINVQSQELRLGVKGGVNFASIGAADNANFDPRVTFHIGGLVEIPLAGKFAIQPELLYSSQGAKQGYYNIIFDSNIKSITKLDYINVPIMGKYYIIKSLSVELGPQVGFLISAKNIYKDHDESGVTNEKDFYNTIDFSVGIGASYRLDNGVFFSLRFNKGISNINSYKFDDFVLYGDPIDGPNYDYDVNHNKRNNVLQLSAGFTF